jgi:hypothetical protein
MKRITKKTAKKLDSELARLVRGMRGGAAQIAAVGGFDHAYVSRVIGGMKPPSMKFLLALDSVLSGVKGRVNSAIIRRAHPEIDRGAHA